MSRAVVSCPEFGRPDAFLKVVDFMPRARALAVIICANLVSVPPRCSPTAAAMSFAERVTSARIACSAVTLPPARTPSFEGGIDAACLETLMRVFFLTLPACMASKSM